MFYSDGAQSKIQSTVWRPVTSVVVGTRIGVLWEQGEDDSVTLVIFQDGCEKVRLPVTGQVPGPQEDLFAVVDVHGTVKALSLIAGAVPPPSPSDSS
eukprot:gnl/TRDRNA2_/TRDRNA2_165778_c0_seq2.p1 gnl/TRDRNA2_/TRDRNA2_165778_c0~~gnl/TRDRNA2_/TRDRNA2_165778_c0_seq2.p1  ORF type:complete len:114 (+),score=15.28 gnl/TRDRNA2_/TRDRNA2_165778_c0_seq2:52-342(+)